MFRPTITSFALASLSLVFPTLRSAAADPSAPATWIADNGDGSYTNPLFYDEFSDPDLIRVGDDYYLTGTTMHSMPGLPVLHSRDLVNWELKGYALTELNLGPENRLEEGETIYGQGIWAPSFRYHNGTFHIFANVNGQTTQHFTATDPAGPWTHRAMKRSLHDLSVLFEDDGRAFVVWGYREIRFAQLNETLDDIVPGTERVLIPADAGFGEGAHFYKFKGRYYISCSNYDPIGYMACARADRIEGPYEITTISAEETFGTGNGWRIAGMGWGEFGEFDLHPPQRHQMGAIPLHQGGIVDTPAGEWWAVSMTDQNSLGRLTALSPLTWQDGWPYFGLPGNLLRTPRTWVKPTMDEPSPIQTPYQRDDTFDGPAVANVWQWNHVPVADAWSLDSRPGFLRLQSLPASDFWFARNTLTQRAMGPESIATTIVDPTGLEPGGRGGLALVNYPYAVLGITREADGGLVLERIDQNAADRISLPLSADTNRIWLRAHCNFDTEQAVLSYSTDGETFVPVGAPFTTIFQLQTFQGVRYGLFNYTTATNSSGHLDFDEFMVVEPRARRSIPFGQEITLTSRAEETVLGVWRGRLRLQTDDEDAPDARFRVIDRGRGRVALQSVADGGYVTVTGLGGPADVKVLPHLDEERSVFQWNHMMQGDVLLMSLATNRYLTASSHVGGLASADSPGADPNRKGGATFIYTVHPQEDSSAEDDAQRAAAHFAREIIIGEEDERRFPEPPSNYRELSPTGLRGTLNVLRYESGVTGTTREATVYLPPEYDPAQRYPVLYLLHGIGGDRHEWTRGASAHAILDNLIAAGGIAPLIAVFPNGRAMADDRVPEQIFNPEAIAAFAAFEHDLLDYLIPAVESNYRTHADADHRALAGLSMGGGQTLNFGLAHLDTFPWVGAFSAAPNTKEPEELVPDPAGTTAALRLLYLSCGNQDALINFSQRTQRYLQAHDVPHLWNVDDHGHDPETWGSNLYHFAQLIFR